MDEDSDLGFLGGYGVTIVPPGGGNGQWFVTLTVWDAESETYRAGTNGPLVETREEAMQQVARVLDWLAQQDGEADLLRVWDQMQEQLGAEGLDVQWPPERGPWGNIIR